MGLGTRLDIAEVASVLAFHKTGLGIKKIAKEMGRSPCAIRNVLRAKDPFHPPPKNSKHPKIGARGIRRLRKAASSSGKSARALKNELQLDASVRSVQRYLKATPWLQYVKRKRSPRLTKRHKDARVAHAKMHLRNPPVWGDIVWSDEKKFNLDGPDGFKYYWHDLRKEKETFMSRQNGGGSIMVWGAFSSAGVSELAVLDGRQDADAYIGTLGDYLMPFGHAIYGNTFIFMQDGASIHTAKVTKEFLEEQDVVLFGHPSLSPDLNPIENLWGDLARAVYSNGQQYDTVSDLKVAVLDAWSQIPLERLATLIKSMPDRCLEVVEKKGSNTHY